MDVESPASALEREHQDIDRDIEAFTADLSATGISPGRLAGALNALRRHIYLEERFLFPPAREAGLIVPVVVMLREHGRIWQVLDTLERQLAGPADPAAVRKTCRELVVRLQHHNLREERDLYPNVDRLLTPGAAAELAVFLRTGRMPEGWACERA